MSAFIQRIVLMLIGSYLTYYVGMQLLNHGSHLETTQEVGTYRNIKLNHHEMSIVPLVTLSDDTDGVTFDDVVGHEKILDDIVSMVITPLSSKTYFSRCALLKPPNGVLLHGPPGTGKTLIARAIAGTTQSNFINFDLGVIENKMYGESLKMLKAVFTLAHKLRPCVIFIDEIDGVFGHRNALDQSHVSAIKTAFLKEIDGFDPRDPSVVLVAATNRKDSIDEALLRRLSLKFYVGLPDEKALNAMFMRHLEQFGYKDCKKFAALCNGMSGAAVLDICKIAAHRAAQRATKQQRKEFWVEDDDVHLAITDMLM